MKSIKNAKILIIDDDIKLVFLLKKFLNLKNFKVDVRYSALDTLRILDREKFDLIIIDMDLDKGTGLSLLQRIRNIGIETPTIMTAENYSLEYEIESYECGTNLFHKKPIELKLLEAQIKALTRNIVFNEVFEVGDFKVDMCSKVVFRKDLQIDLTKLEFNLLLLFLKSNGRLYSRDEILSKVFYNNSDVSYGAVDTLISRLRKKLGESSESYFIETVFKSGYRLNSLYFQKGFN